MPQPKPIAILGSTGSVGVSTLDVCRRHPERFRPVALAAGHNSDLLLQQIREFAPELVSVVAAEDAKKIKPHLPAGVEMLWGEEGSVAVASYRRAETVVSAIVGAAGLGPTMAAIAAGKTIALANKESMVIAGSLMADKARAAGVKIVPVDSEHSAIFQCLNGEHIDDVERLILTASGGPFLNREAAGFKSITRAEALRHPNWAMGDKITIDSATMMNKGLEVMEARWLFGLPVERIAVVVHPQSIVHSMVEFCDGSVMAQMGEPDMRVPIAYALSYPRRIATGVARLDLPARRELTFITPDLEKFRCLKVAFEVARNGRSYAPVLNAANECAVAAFLAGRVRFDEIAVRVENCLESHDSFELTSIEDVLSADAWARDFMTQHT